MAIEAIVTDKAPAALGPYSAAVSATGTRAIHVSGQLPIDPATGEVTVLLDDIADFGAMNEVYGEFFTAPYPSRAAFEVAALPKAAKVEIKAVAYL